MDPEILEMVEGLLQKNKYKKGFEFQSGNPFTDYQRYIETVAQRMSEVGDVFSLEQAALKAMNPMKPKLYNPATPFLPPPIGGGFVTDSLDAPQAFISAKDPRDDVDIHKLDYEGHLIKIQNGGPTAFSEVRKTVFPDGKNRKQIIKEQNLYPTEIEESRKDFSYIDFENLDIPGRGKGLKRQDINGVPIEVVDYESIFDKKRYGPGYLEADRGGEFYKPKTEAKFRKTRTMATRAGAIENPDAFFSLEDFQKGYITGDFANTYGVDPDKYVPFFFQDLRRNDRRIYFRAFLTRFGESIAPEWTQEKFYGRVDPVPIYKGTSRTFQVGFKVAAFSPAGFSTMWKKINQLSKMVYPTFRENVLVASPVLRVKIGDVMADGTGQGLPGYISSPLEISYPENSPWEINDVQAGSFDENAIQLGRAPMIVEISFTYQVIHEKNPELDQDYNFDFFNFRGIGIVDEPHGAVEESEENPSTEVESDTVSDGAVGDFPEPSSSESVA